MIRRYAGLLLAVSTLAVLGGGPTARAADRPNILWLTSEDHGPHMGCYGDRVASTPNVDRLAARGMIYTRAWSYAPARTTLNSGLYATSTGAELREHLADPSPDVRIVAVQALGKHSSAEDVKRVLPVLVKLCARSENDVFTSLAALNALDALGEWATPALAALKALKTDGSVPHARYAAYASRLMEDLLAGLEGWKSLP